MSHKRGGGRRGRGAVTEGGGGGRHSPAPTALAAASQTRAGPRGETRGNASPHELSPRVLSVGLCPRCPLYWEAEPAAAQ